MESRHAGSGISHTASPSSTSNGRQPGRDAADRPADERRVARRIVGTVAGNAGTSSNGVNGAGAAPAARVDDGADVLLAALEARVDPVEVERYFGVGGVRVERRGDRAVRVLGSSGFLTRLVEKRFGSVLLEAAEESFGEGVEVEYAVDPAADAIKPSEPVEAIGRSEAPVARVAPSGDAEPALDPNSTLDDFCVGPTNRLAYAAALRLAEQPESFGGPLFLHGPCGVGKTHLLQGVARRIMDRAAKAGRAARVRYVNAEDFVSEFTLAIRKNATDKFRAKYRKLDLLCVDDVHLIAGKPATQQELVQTINATELASGRLALASDAHPRQLGHMSDALVSRFMAGMVVKVDLPDAGLARQLIARIAARRNLPVQPAAVERIAEFAARAAAASAKTAGVGAVPSALNGTSAVCCSVRELEGMVLKVEAVWRLLPELSGSPVGVLAVERALGDDRADAPQSGPRRPPRGDEVVAAACRVLGVSASEFMGRGRHKRVVLARSIAATLCRRFTTMSYPEIARAMGRPNHSTVITACQRLGRQLEHAEPSGLDGELAGVSIARLIELADEETRRIAFGDRQGLSASTGGLSVPSNR